MASPSGVAKHSVLLLRRGNDRLTAALHARYRVLSFYASGSGAPLPAFLAASASAAAQPEPPRAALVVGDGTIRVDAAFLDAAPYLRCVVTTAAGMDHIELAECARRGVLVAGAGEVFSTDVADHAVGLLIDVLRQVSATDRYVRRGMWPVQGDYPLGSKLGGKRVGIIGLGSIGSSIAKRLKAFGCVIQYHSRRPKDTVSFTYFPDVISLAAESDVLVVACALNDQTLHIVNEEVLEALGKGGVVVNIARGGNIDEAALIRALEGGEIAGAGLDVFEREPEVPAELLSMDNVVLTAHEAVFTTESRSDLCDLMVGNLEAFFGDCLEGYQDPEELGCPLQRPCSGETDKLLPGSDRSGELTLSAAVGVTLGGLVLADQSDASPRSPPRAAAFPSDKMIFFSPCMPLNLPPSPEPSPMKKSRTSTFKSPLEALMV